MTRSEHWSSILARLAGMVPLLILLVTAPAAQAQTFTVLHSFTGPEGTNPYSGLIMDHAGRLYGTAYAGGAHGFGTVYRIARAGSGWIATGLYSFQGGMDGAYPAASVAFGPDGTLYGTTAGGGSGGNEYGTVFNLRPPASVCKAALCPWTETVLHRFSGGSDGATPDYADALVFDQGGNIYGTTASGGAHGYGVVFELTHSGGIWTENVLWSFTGGDDGGSPTSGVIFDSAGNLYGTGVSGGAHGDGVVYELSPSESGWTQTTLYSFSGADAPFPAGGVTMDANGNLYGTTGGPQGQGEAYELTQTSGNWSISRRQILSVSYNGPYDTPTLDAEGNLYGTSSFFGAGCGEVFKMTPFRRWRAYRRRSCGRFRADRSRASRVGKSAAVSPWC
ncbi:MAG: choice-of-anchor tandem repeat GloVer-containing protein [Candidatus Korobacteraceae bacterium]